MSSNRSNFAVRRVSSQAMIFVFLMVERARSVTSAILPIGVATINKVPVVAGGLSLVILSFLIAGCGSVATQPPARLEPVQVRQPSVQLALLEKIRSDPELALRNALDAYRNGNDLRANETIESIDGDSGLKQSLNANSRFTYQLLKAHLTIDAGENARQAVEILIPRTERQRVATLDLWSRMLSHTEQFVAASISSIQAKRLAIATAQTDLGYLNRQLWQALTALPNPQIHQLKTQFGEESIEPWLTLALEFNNSLSLIGWQDLLREKATDYPGHEAIQYLQRADDQQDNKPLSIAVLLPQSGNDAYAQAAQAIRDGIMLAYLNDQKASADREAVDLAFYDTTGQDVNQILRQAIQAGSQRIIGPLTRDAVNQLSRQSNIGVDMLMLNTPDEIQRTDSPPPHSRYLTWSIEDEARTLARLISQRDDQRCILIYGSEPWMIRARAEFEQNLLEPARVIGIKRIGEFTQITNDIGTSLGIEASERRAETIESIVNFSLEFVPRVNQEINSLVAFINAEQLEVVLESLRYHADRKVTVYMTESAMRGEIPELADEVEFTSSAWRIFESDLAETTQELFKPNPNLLSFYTLGIDAYRFSSLLINLEENRSITGIGSRYKLDSQGNIRRLPYLGIVRDGSLEPNQTIEDLNLNNPYL